MEQEEVTYFSWGDLVVLGLMLPGGIYGVAYAPNPFLQFISLALASLPILFVLGWFILD